MRDLYLSKEKAEVLGSRLQQWNLLEPGTTISFFRNRNQILAQHYASAQDKVPSPNKAHQFDYLK